MVDVGIDQNRARDRGLPQTGPGMEFGSGFDLAPKVGRRTEQVPGQRVAADNYLGLAPGLAGEGALPQGPAVRAGAIPLRKGATGGGTQNLHEHATECSKRAVILRQSKQTRGCK